MAKLIFLHGLNTFGDDEMHLGPFKFGPMHRHLEPAFRSRGVEFFGITGLGSGSAEAQAENAWRQIQELGLDQEPELHVLAHSVGGLAARALAARSELRHRVRHVITIGTPHHGDLVAEVGAEFYQRHPYISRTLTTVVRYDPRARRKIFQNFTRTAVSEFNRRFPISPGIREISLICDVRPSQVCLPLRLLSGVVRSKLNHSEARKPSDGLIFVSSQTYGECLGPFAVDHIASIGFFLHHNPFERRRSRREFSRLIDQVCRLLKEVKN